MDVELDPRWEWVECPTLGQLEPYFIKGRCNHLELEPVDEVLYGERVAVLCRTCDAVLPPETVIPDR